MLRRKVLASARVRSEDSGAVEERYFRPMPTHDILCFGVARDIAGGDHLRLALEAGATVADLRRTLEERYPALTELTHYALARNETYARPEEIVAPADVLAILPPVSGG